MVLEKRHNRRYPAPTAPPVVLTDEERVKVHARVGTQRKGLLTMISDLPDRKLVMVEVGCFRGDSAILFMRSGKIQKLFAVDVWRDDSWIRLAEPIFDAQTKSMNVIKLKMTMNEAVELLPEVDFVYIDADHSYDWVKSDILNALKVIKKGGIIAGHDYAEPYKDRVVKAVDEVLGKPDRVYADTSWLKFL